MNNFMDNGQLRNLSDSSTLHSFQQLSRERDVNKSSGFRQDFPDPDDAEIQIPDLLDAEENVRELDFALDQLNSALDDLEARNENIQTMLLALLNESREARKELAAINKSSQQ